MDKVFAASLRGIVCVVALAGLAACGQDGQGAPEAASSAPQPQFPNAHNPLPPPAAEPTPSKPAGASNVAPQINGTPSTQAVTGQNFTFQPNATDADGDTLSFSISSKPAWASFDANTGRLSGTPQTADVGSHEGIEITVSDGEHRTALAAFDVNVIEQADGAATVSWQPPTENTDGSALINLKGYRIHYGTSSGKYEHTVSVDNAGVASFVIENLTSGTWFFAVSAVAVNGTESEPSAEATKTI